MDFIIEFKTLAIKVDTDKLYAIFLLKKNVQVDIIKTILEYLLIAMSETLREWKVAITSVKQEYESIEEWHNYRTGLETTYRRQEIPIDIGKAKDNFDKDGKPKCFNCNEYKHIVKDCKKPKKEKKNTRKYYKYK